MYQKSYLMTFWLYINMIGRLHIVMSALSLVFTGASPHRSNNRLLGAYPGCRINLVGRDWRDTGHQVGADGMPRCWCERMRNEHRAGFLTPRYFCGKTSLLSLYPLFYEKEIDSPSLSHLQLMLIGTAPFSHLLFSCGRLCIDKEKKYRMRGRKSAIRLQKLTLFFPLLNQTEVADSAIV